MLDAEEDVRLGCEEMAHVCSAHTPRLPPWYQVALAETDPQIKSTATATTVAADQESGPTSETETEKPASQAGSGGERDGDKPAVNGAGAGKAQGPRLEDPMLLRIHVRLASFELGFGLCVLLGSCSCEKVCAMQYTEFGWWTQKLALGIRLETVVRESRKWHIVLGCRAYSTECAHPVACWCGGCNEAFQATQRGFVDWYGHSLFEGNPAFDQCIHHPPVRGWSLLLDYCLLLLITALPPEPSP